MKIAQSNSLARPLSCEPCLDQLHRRLAEHLQCIPRMAWASHARRERAALENLPERPSTVEIRHTRQLRVRQQAQQGVTWLCHSVTSGRMQLAGTLLELIQL